jgi:hypothetical protein
MGQLNTDMKLINKESVRIAPSASITKPVKANIPILSHKRVSEISKMQSNSTIRPTSKAPSRHEYPNVNKRLNPLLKKMTTGKRIPELFKLNKVKREIVDAGDVQHEIALRKKKSSEMLNGDMSNSSLNTNEVKKITSNPQNNVQSQKYVQSNRNAPKPSEYPSTSNSSKSKSTPNQAPANNRRIEDVLHDHDYVNRNTSSIIQELMGRNRKRRQEYSDEEDSSDMEVGFDDLR